MIDFKSFVGKLLGGFMASRVGSRVGVLTGSSVFESEAEKAVGDIVVRLGGRDVTLRELIAPHICVSWKFPVLTARRADGSLDISTVYDESVKIVSLDGRGNEVVEYPSVGRTQQQFKDECDVNSIMAKYERSGLLPLVTDVPVYGDFTSGSDFLDTQRRVAFLKSRFELLPASVRSGFDNDAAKMIDFALSPDNEARCVELGILPKKVEPVVSADKPVVVAPEAPAAAAASAAPAVGTV